MTTTTMPTLGGLIRAHRKAMGLTQKQLGERLNPPVLQTTVSSWEADTNEPGLRSLVQLQRVLKVRWEELLLPYT